MADNKGTPQVTQSSNSDEPPPKASSPPAPTAENALQRGDLSQHGYRTSSYPEIVAAALGNDSEMTGETAMSEGSWVPKTWGEAIPAIIWGVIILGCGLELVPNLLEEHYGRAAFAFLGLVALTAMLIHWRQLQQRFQDQRWLVAAIMVLIVTLALSPFIEERRWPFSAWLPLVIQSQGPTADQIADAVVKKLPPAPQIPDTDATKAIASLQTDKDKLQAELTTATAARDALQQQLKSLLPQAAAPATSPYIHLTDARRWQIVKTLIDGADLPHGCAAIQSLNNDGTPEFRKTVETWGEVQQPLHYAGWHFTQGNRSFIPPGIGIVVTSKTGPAGMCGTRLKDLLDGLNISPVSFRIDPSSLSLAQCPDNNCIEVIIGKLESP